MTEPHDVLEALLFASDAPVEAALIQEVLELPSADAARALVQELRTRFEAQDRVLQIIEAGGGFRLVTRPEVAPWLVKLARSKTKSRLSRPALETLAIIAYRQPVSRPEVDAARGVNSEGVLDNLLERRLVRIAGRKDSAGRPFLYETTREFLGAFGLRDLGDLPKVEGELIVVDPAAAADTAVGDADAADTAPADASDTAHATADPIIAEAAGTEAAVAGPASAESTERAAETRDVTPATDSHQQDPGPEGTELAPRG
jgi:segregation and condensation protein B